MKTLHLFGIALLFAAGLYGQSVTATARREILLPGSEAIFLVTVTAAGLGVPLGDVIEALTSVGIEPRNLAGRSADVNHGETFLFRLVRPAASYAETQASLLQAVASSRRGLRLTFTAYTQPSQTDIDKARASIVPDLFRETKARGERMLIEAGYQPGPILELAESIEPETQGRGVRVSLSLRMARAGGSEAAGAGASVSTMVTPLATPYRIGAPVLTASYPATPQTRARLFERLAPTGLTEANLTGIDARPDTFHRQPEPGPVMFTYRFTVPLNEADVRQLPIDDESSVRVDYPVEAAATGPAALAESARSRATLLAGLLGGTLGEGSGLVAADGGAVPTVVARSGDFSAVSTGPLLQPPTPLWYRYRFVVR